jgi:Uma2 family endonuclease
MPVSARTYEQIALEDPEGQWELWCGELRSKPGMTFAHNDLMTELGFILRSQLDPSRYRVRINAGRVRHGETHYYIPDVVVIPVELTASFRNERFALEAYSAPLPLVVEVWSPSTGAYDVDTKLPEYQRRGDQEIWRIHPYEHTLTTWRRREDGSYEQLLHEHGPVRPIALAGVSVDLDMLFGSANQLSQ